MSHTHNHHHHPRKPRRVRAPSERAEGLDPQITAQPHGLSEDIDPSADESGLSVDPEELGTHFLSEAVDQGDFGARDVAELELKLRAEESAAASVDIDLGVWETLSSGSADELREFADFRAERLAEEREPEPERRSSRSLDMHASAIRDGSLLDREGAQADETITPRVESDDSGRHARSTSRDALGEQVSGARAAAGSGKQRTSKLQRAAQASLRSAAGKLRGMASKLAKATRH